jgi:hypothetical protein
MKPFAGSLLKSGDRVGQSLARQRVVDAISWRLPREVEVAERDHCTIAMRPRRELNNTPG